MECVIVEIRVYTKSLPIKIQESKDFCSGRLFLSATKQGDKLLSSPNALEYKSPGLSNIFRWFDKDWACSLDLIHRTTILQSQH